MGWSQPAKKRASDLERCFKTNLREIADCLARHDQADSVSAPHVDRAFDALASAGLNKKRWIDRPDAETGLGGTCVGAAFAVPSGIQLLFSDDRQKWVATSALVSLFVIGVVLIAHGTYRARLPSSSAKVSTWGLFFRRVAFALLATIVICVLVAAVVAAWQYVFWTPSSES